MTAPGQPAKHFYVVGGTMLPDAPSYIERRADHELFEKALAGEFCYVLTTRQVGKSSLMIRTAEKLRAVGVKTAIIDLTQIGTARGHQAEDQWYYSMADVIVEELDLEVDLGAWWKQRQSLSALQRLVRFFRDIVLALTAEPVTIFVDEIDSTLTLSFTDDFFAAIRACHNARANEPAYQRLSFVLLGVASPSDLIADTQRTPFNIGHRIELTDFDVHEAKPMAQGLAEDEKASHQALAHILAWTGGHPYLTQKLCDAVAQHGMHGSSDAEIAQVVEQTFLRPGAERNETNLRFIRDRLIGFQGDVRRLLALYRRIWRGKRVEDDPLSPSHLALKLAGLVISAKDGTLHIRNRIYERVFTDAWVKQAMPGDWNRRAAVAAMIMLFLLPVGWYEVIYPRQQIATFNEALEDDAYAVARHAYDNLRRVPFYRAKANALWADFWGRRALRDEQRSRRDHALLWRLKAAAADPTDEGRARAVGALVSTDYPRLLATARHDDWVVAVAFSPDGTTLATASSDNTARLWDAATGTPRANPLRHDDSVFVVAFSPDGTTLATASSDNTARLWDVATGTPRANPLRHDRLVRAVAFSPDGTTLATASSDSTARLWDVATGTPRANPLRHNRSVVAVAFSPDGTTLATASESYTVRLWDVATGTLRANPLRHDDWVVAVAFSPDGTTLATASDDNTARLWDVATGTPRANPLRHDDSVFVVAFSPDGTTLATVSYDNTARLWDVATGTPRANPLRHDLLVRAVAFSPDGTTLATASWDSTARLWDVATGTPRANPLRHDDPVIAVAFSPDGTTLATASWDSTARLWDVATGTLRANPLRHDDWVVAVAFSPDGTTLATASLDNTARLWDVATDTPRANPLRHDRLVRAVAFSPDGTTLATASWDSTARLWDVATGTPRAKPLRHDDPVIAVAFSPDGTTLATASESYTVRLWDVATGTPRAKPLRHDRLVRAVAFSPDGTILATASWDSTARLWDVATGTLRANPLRHDDWVVAVAFSPDGTTLATASYDNTARLWDVATGTPRAKPLRHDASVRAVAFSPDGNMLVAATLWWIHASSVNNEMIAPIASRLLPGAFKGPESFRFRDLNGRRIQIAVGDTGNTFLIPALNFDLLEAEPIQGEPEELLDEWQKKLGLKIDENGEIISLWQ